MQPKYYGAAAQYNKPAGGSGGLGGILKIFGIFVGAIIIIAIALTVVNSIGKGPQNEFARLVALESELQSLLDKQKQNINSSDLKTINASAHLLVTGDVSALTTQMTAAFGLAAVPEDIAAAAADPTVETTLKNASLTGTFDKVYVSVLRDQLAANYQLANSLLGSASTTAMQDALQKAMETMEAIDGQLEKLQI